MEETELKFDSKRVKQLIKKYHLFLLILIPLFFSVFFRAYTYDLPITDNMARSSVENNLRSQIQADVLSQSPNIDQNTLNTLVSQRLQSFVNTNGEEIEQQVEIISQQIKSYYKDDSGQTYLLAIDPYFYLRQAENVVENGHVGDELKDGKPFDNHMLAPNGRNLDNNFHPWIGAAIYRVSSIFGNNSVLGAMFILPLIFAALSTIPAFFITRKVAGNLGGLVAAFVVAIHPTFLGRTPAGFSDTDTYTIFFPLMIIWVFLEAFTTDKTKNKYILGSVAGLLTGIFAFAWGGWWYIFDILIATLIIYFLYLLIRYKKSIFKKIKTKNLIRVSIPYLISSAIFVSAFAGVSNFINTINAPIGVIFIKEAARSTLWPNVYTTVAELNSIPFSQVINMLNGKIFFGMAILGILSVFFKKKKKQIDIKYGILMLLWLAGTLYSTTKGTRFVMFVIPIFAIGLGIFFGNLYRIISNWVSKELKINKIIISISLIILVVFVFIPLTIEAKNVAEREVPSMNDAWYGVLTKIKLETPEDAIVNSWWDFGHWFKAIADRKVTFDGASQDTPPAHWMGKVLLTSNEKEAIAILRMLDCGSNDAYDLLLEETQDPLETKRIIDKIILKDKNEARNILNQYTTNPEKILEKTHCNPPDNYFITSEDMVSKAGVWAHFGAWDFEKAFTYNAIKENSREKAISDIQTNTRYTKEEAESIFTQLNGLSEQQANSWISPFTGYSSSGQCQEQNKTIVCSNGLIINPDNTAMIRTNNGNINIAYRDGDNVYRNSQDSSEISAAYIPSKSSSILMHPSLLESTFTDLFFYEGKNSEYFELFDHQQGISGFDIYVWKVKWTSQ